MPRLSSIMRYLCRTCCQSNRPLFLMILSLVGLMSGLASTTYADSCLGQIYDVGRYPHSIAAGDFNGDGKLDLVTANNDFGNVSVLLGDGAGRFGASKVFGVGPKPEGVAVADFNGDNKADIVTANFGAPNVSVLLSDGAGGFGAATNYSTAAAPRTVAVGDFNNDGKKDLAAGSSVLTILLGDGAGHFSPSTNISGVGATSISVADFNRDGNADLVAGRGGFSHISIFLGNGSGGFGATTDIQVGNSPEDVAAGDLNGDGKPDLAVTHNVNSFPPQVAVLLNDGKGGFAPLVNYGMGGSQPTSISIGDFDSDGNADLGVANYSAYSSIGVSILPGNGTGSFGAAKNYRMGGASALVSGDFNADGKLDLAVSYTVSNVGKVSVLFNSCNAVPAPGPPPTPAPTYSISGKIVNATSPFTSVSLSGTQSSLSGVDQNGNYIFTDLPSGGTYTVTPSAEHLYYQYAFSPASRTFTNLSANQVADFTQTLGTNSISGKVTGANGVGLAGIEVVVNMGTAGKTVTDNNGNYSFPKMASGNHYRVAPSSVNYMFTPNVHVIDSLSADVIANFTSNPLYNITGRVTDQNGAAMAGVFVSVNGPMSRSTTTDNNGNYLLNSLPAGGNYIMSISTGGYAFDPPGRTFNNLSGHQTANFTGIPAFNVTGYLTLANGQGINGVTMTVSGSYPTGTPYTAMTTAYNGFYNISFLAAGGTYTITPLKDGYSFKPASKTFQNLSGHQTSNFVGEMSIQLLLDTSGSEPNQAVALDSQLFLRDPFPVISAATLLNQLEDRSTRIVVLVTGLRLVAGETPATVIVNLVDSNNHSYEIPAEAVQPMPDHNFTEVVFRLPANLLPGTATIKVKAHGQESNAGTIRIKS